MAAYEQEDMAYALQRAELMRAHQREGKLQGQSDANSVQYDDEALAYELMLQELGQLHTNTRPRAAERARVAGAGPSQAGPSDAGPSRGQQAANATSSLQRARQPTIKCVICIEDVPLSDTACISSDCGHLFCYECVSQYVLTKVKDRKYPIVCPAPGCTATGTHETLLELMQPHDAELKVYAMLQVEHAVAKESIYCPYRGCNKMLVKPDVIAPDLVSTCPECKRKFCLYCNIPGLHEGFTCAEFQRLPPEQRRAEDAALFCMSHRNKWRQCPSCKHMVERVAGCNHVKCLCGQGFCFQCGSAYRSNQPTANNLHGQPGCQCGLFPLPAQRED